MTAFDFRAPDYDLVRAERIERLEWLRSNPDALAPLRLHYAENPIDFIADWGVVTDPRNQSTHKPVEMPFVLFDRQREMLQFILDRMRNREPGLIEKSRDCGASWLSMCLAATLCLFNRGVVVGVGSSKELKLDRSGDPDTLLWKARFFIAHVPPEFRGGWDETKHSAHLRVMFPETGSAITAEAGDSIGRGGRSTLYLVDESAFVERPALIDASLASNTECRIDISTPNGPANSFAIKRHSGTVPVFTFHWRDDPRKDDAWYQRQCELLDPITRRQEIDLDYNARIEGVLIPSEWVQAAVGAHRKLGIDVTGARRAALDVADEGKDLCALAGRRGVLLEYVESWSGKGSDIYRSVVKAFGICDAQGYSVLEFDADGLGAGVRGDAVNINVQRLAAGKREINAEPFRGSGAVLDPEGSMVEGRLNRDYFANYKAQSWWSLRLRFQSTYRAVVEGMPYDADEIIAIDPDLPELTQLTTELSQPTYSVNGAGKIVVNKMPDGAASPNRADAVMIAYAARVQPFFSVPAAVTATASEPVMPSMMDRAFATVVVVDAVAAAVHVASNRVDDGTRGHGFYVLDWDVVELGEAAEHWIFGVRDRLEELYEIVRTRIPWPTYVFIDDGDGPGYTELIRQRGFQAIDVGADLPPAADRVQAARPYFATGLVQVAAPARERVVTFRGTTRNFLRELSEQPEVGPTSALAQALATAVLIGYHGRGAVPAAPAVAPAPAPDRQPQPSPAEIEIYEAAVAEYRQRRVEALTAARARFGPGWQPHVPGVLGIGEPPQPPWLRM